MKKALSLAKKGMGCVSPNPCVGAVAVKNNIIIGQGYHKRFGGPHAEVEALKGLGKKDLKGVALYVTLEPCSHHGKTPPCVDMIIDKGIEKVVVGAEDKNPRVNGKGIEKLAKHGVNVKTGVMEKEIEQFYKPFFKYATKGIPFVTLKAAQSLDGKNSVKKDTKYLLSEKALAYVHKLRFYSDAVMVGVNTILADNPSLDIRFYGKKKPLIKAILDAKGRTPANARVFQTPGKTLIYTANKDLKVKKYDNAEIIYVPEKEGFLNLQEVFKDLGRRSIQNLLVEGGGILSFNLLKEKLVDRLLLFIAPYIIGGADFPSFGHTGFNSLAEAVKLDNYTISSIESNILLSADLK